jgi:ATP-dependent Lhr-like helicase
MLRTVRCVIVDEIHALVSNKRGAHLALSLERLEALTKAPLTRIGLSATQRPIEEVGRFLVGQRPEPTIVDCGHKRELKLAIEMPQSPLDAVMSHEVWSEVYDRIAQLIEENSTTLVFVGNRRMAERLCRHLGERVGEESVAAHHGSLSKERRLDAELRLKAGRLKALVATASLELGIDVGSVDLVCQIGSARGIAQLLQRVGRSGHHAGGIPDGRLFPLSRNDLVECAALMHAVKQDRLDAVSVIGGSLDILAQQIVASTAGEDWPQERLFEVVRQAYPYRNLERERFDAVLQMLAEGFDPRRGSRRALIRWDRVTGVVSARKSARLVALTSGGAIADNTDYRVVLEPDELHIGSIHEDFAIEAMAGDIFQLGNASWQILKVETGLVRVADAKGQPPTIPFWLGEAPSRSDELSLAVSQLRARAVASLGSPTDADSERETRAWFTDELGVPEEGARQLVEYFTAAIHSLGTLPTQETLVMERFFDEASNTHLVIHSPYGARVNRAWGLALRKRFCRSFNFELQAAASEDAIILSLGPTHSFDLDEVQRFLNTKTAQNVLVQALLDAPMFEIRWRHNTTRALATPRQRGGKKVPPFLLRIQADDLLSTAFPDQQACLENIAGDREIPDHPLVQQTIEDCLTEAMDSKAFLDLLGKIERAEVTIIHRDLPEPSAFSHEILNANPYAFLDPAPLEERRTQAVMTRRAFGGARPDELGALDASAIERVRTEAWPSFSSADELCDALTLAAFISPDELKAPNSEQADARHADPGQAERWMNELCESGRATRLQLPGRTRQLWVSAARTSQFRSAFPQAIEAPPLQLPSALVESVDAATALTEIVRGRLESLGPATNGQLCEPLGGESRGELRGPVEAALLALQTEGVIMRGRFTPDAKQPNEWCERGLLARIHRYTLDRLRKEIEPVTSAAFMRFLVRWHHLTQEDDLSGPQSLAVVLSQLEGFKAAAGSWESALLPIRLRDYDPAWLDQLCLSGQIVWGRLGTAIPSKSKPSRSLSSTPLVLCARQAWSWLSAGLEPADVADLSPNARRLVAMLERRGACFLHDLRSVAPTRSELEMALSEAVARGRVSSDSFAGVRALLSSSKPRPLRRRSRPGRSPSGLEAAGRWSLLHPDPTGLEAYPHEADDREATTAEAPSEPTPVAAWARLLLRRYGVVFRALLEREDAPPWRDLLREYRRLEARGEVRGGRFIQRHAGEQFALPEAIPLLRKVRNGGSQTRELVLSACDPLNLVGSVLPGDKIAATPSNSLMLRDGHVVAALEGGKLRCFTELAEPERARIQRALERGPAAPTRSPLVGVRPGNRRKHSESEPVDAPPASQLN